MSDFYKMEGDRILGPQGECLGIIPDAAQAARTLKFLNAAAASGRPPTTVPRPEVDPQLATYQRRYIDHGIDAS